MRGKIKKKRVWVLKHGRGEVLRKERNCEAQKELRYLVNNKGNKLIFFFKNWKK
jgi:hypothetical protein